ncbi:nucleoside diphosphate kinase homolog 7-like [Clavelina lepadiformis]|uniref:nucleoside diphosphate kinase homolog 7-like n=1 Tax=Clavelina lepadiformis TaxID=159417 RepID=UPI00404256EF
MFPGYSDAYIEPSSAQDERYSFITEWYDPQAALIRRYQFLYYPKDSSVEMYDIKNRRKFLSRTKFDHVKVEDLYIGSKLSIYSRQLTFVDFGDRFTESKMGNKNEKTLAIVKPDAVSKLGTIINCLKENDIQVCKAKMVQLTRKDAAIFYEEHQSKPFYNPLLDYMTSGPVVAMEIMGSDAVKQWRKLLGPTDSNAAREQEPTSLRAMFGTDNTKNAAHGSDSATSAKREIEFFFPSSGKSKLAGTAKYENCTCCVIKPHAVKSGLIGDILSVIQDAGFAVTDLSMQNIEKANAEEFYEVYKSVVAEYQSMVNELCNGPCVALEITGKDQDTANRFREFCGPADPEIARHLRPKTIRAMFGKDKIQNAVHCTDLPDDGILEVEYFFRILPH